MMEKLQVALGKNSYFIYLGSGILSSIGQVLSTYKVNNKVLVVTNPTVGSLYSDTVADSLRQAGFAVRVLELPDGEEFKRLDIAEKIYQAAVDNNLNRKSTIMALGGGVIGDMAGFAAATFMRGVNFVQVPTTLLAQVDSSVGGKVAVNHAAGKNLIGCFYQPLFVFSDILTLKTLPVREWRTGMAEVVKYGVIWDKNFFSYLNLHCAELNNFSAEVITTIVRTSCGIKAQVVEKDEKEDNLRAILNYGHTVGHGVENLTNYSVYTHGEAVAIGMVSAALIAQKMGLLPEAETEKIKELLLKVGLAIALPELDLAKLITALYHDKKVVSDKLRFVLPVEIGKVIISDEVSEGLLERVLQKQMRG